MINKFYNYRVIFIISVILFSSCTPDNNSLDTGPTTNSETSLHKPYVILISLDGFRWDYVERFQPPQLSNFIKNGVAAQSLIPSFPSKTFPNHYTLATGMYPDHHGILGNSFYSYKKDLTYSIGNRERVEDGSFYGGSPLWVQADKADMVSASFFFVGSEADVQGIRPTYYYQYDGSIKNDERIAQALKWLALPEEERPHLITLYFSDMDDTGHRYGPNNDEELKKTLFALDKQLGDLFKGAKDTGLSVNFVIVSDHGMSEVKNGNFIPLEDFKNDSLFLTIDNGAIINIHPKNENQIDSIFQILKEKENNFKVYRTEDTPGFEYIPQNKDWGKIQIIPDYGYYFLTNQGIEARKKYPDATYGVHGYDPEYSDMHGIFYANGPAFKEELIIPPIKNIHIYPLICRVLGLEIPENIDGQIDKIEVVLKNQ